MKNLIQAVLKVMDEVKGIEKSMTVGSGGSSYKGVSDKDVKKIIGEAMQRNGLVIFPIAVNTKTEVSRWEEEDIYSKSTPKPMKTKQSVFTEAETSYLLAHESGESQIICGYGHGVDTQDKGAGKATTYALKNTLLYTFLVPTGTLDDTDKVHSDSIEVPQAKPKPKISGEPFENMKKAVGKGEFTTAQLLTLYALDEEQKQVLQGIEYQNMK